MRFFAASIGLFLLGSSAIATQKPAQKFAQGTAIDTQFPPAYNAPASIDVEQSRGVSFFADASFTYWFAQEDGLAIAFTSLSNDTLSGQINASEYSDVLYQSSNFKPGFKIGTGAVVNSDTIFRAEYTWYRAKNITHGSTLTGTGRMLNTDDGTGTEVWVFNDWFYTIYMPGSSVQSKWKLGMDLVDTSASRPFYQGKRLIISPFGGLRAAWIRQSVILAAVQSPIGSPNRSPTQPIYSRTHSNSWGIGPRFGVQSQCLLWGGFQINASGAASLLYTQYTSIKHTEDPQYVGELSAHTSMNHIGAMRPAAEMNLGLGWGSYLANNSYYLSFNADYGFAIYWSQNMIRYMLDYMNSSLNPPPGDLFLQGLSLGANLNF